MTIPSPRRQSGTHQGDHPVTPPDTSIPHRARPKYLACRPRLRLAAVGAALLTLPAITALVPPATAATARTTVQASSTRAATPAAASGQGQVPLNPVAPDSSATVTLITGQQVRVAQAPGGRDTASAVPGSGAGVDISEQTGPGGVTTSLRAIPQDETAQQLISSGQVNQGLFDLQWLVTHGDTGPDAQIPVTIAYAGHLTSARLHANSDSLPGTAVQAVNAGSGQVQATVAASRAAAFWAALTSPAPAAASANGPARPTLVGGATGIWLTGHQVTPAASPQPQAGQPLYTVTETITRATGPLMPPGATCNWAPDQQGTLTYGPVCFNGYFNYGLWGVAGPGQEVNYGPNPYFFDGNAWYEECVDEKPAAPSAMPTCSAWQLSYSVPAGVYYVYGSGGIDTTDNTDNTLERDHLLLDVPQLTVTGDTSLTLNADRAVPVKVTTPQPGEQQGSAASDSRQLSDGISTSIAYNTSPYSASWLAVPTPAGDAATIGQYSFAIGMSLQRPQFTATVTPGNLTLHPLYATCPQNEACNGNVAQFSGSQALQVVDAGQGTASDFSTINAQGKLALIRVGDCSSAEFAAYCPGGSDGGDYVEGIGAPVLWPQIENALQAGAAGVLLDAGTDQQGDPNFLPAHVLNGIQLHNPSNGGPVGPLTPDLPVAAIDNTDANALLGQMAKGPVTVNIDVRGQTPYVYFLSFAHEGQIPDSLNYTVTSHQLAEIDNSYHSASPSAPVTIEADAVRADYDTDGAGGSLDITSPAAIREYYGPLSPSSIWLLDQLLPPDTTCPANTICLQGVPVTTWKVFDQPGSTMLDWNELPAAPGAPAPSTDAYKAQPNYLFSIFGVVISPLHFCAACTQGGTFYPVFYDISGANPGAAQIQSYGFAPGSIHLYNQAGQEIQPTPQGSIATYQLPAQQAQYKLVTPTTTWDFTDPGTPATDHTPQETYCGGVYYGASTAPCQAEPLVFLRYNAGLSPGDTITPGTRQLQVTGYHQDPTAPPVTSLKLWTSTDGGTTWQSARVTGGSGGTFTVTYTVPASGTNGYISIKAQASDSAGNDITQEFDNAYAIAGTASASASGK
jgi:hypothetical protein